MHHASCHCGTVQLEIARKPRTLTNCNCSICRRYGALWAYYSKNSVRITSGNASLSRYAWGDCRLTFCFCTQCGCLTHYMRTNKKDKGKMAVNARCMDPELVASIPVRHFDGASTWKYIKGP